MADNTNMEINIEAQNNAESGFSSLTSSIESLQSTIEKLTETFSQFTSNVDRSMNSAKDAVESLSSTADSAMSGVASSSEDAARGIESSLGDAAKQSANTIEDSMRSAADSIDSMGKSTDSATRSIDDMASNASKSFDTVDKSSQQAAQGISKGMEEAAAASTKTMDDMVRHMDEGFGSMKNQMDMMFAGMSFQAIAQPLQQAVGSAIKVYGDFDQAVANVNSMMGLTPPQVNNLKNQLIDLSKTVPEGPTALANALYGVVGAGVPANQAMSVLNVSAKAATAGQTDLGTATNALIAVMDSYGLKADSLGKISDQMFAANQAGAMTFDSFAKSIGNVAGPAAQVGVSFDQVAAATAALTNQGLSAQRATQGLRALLVGIAAPTQGATKEAQALGIQWDSATLKSKGLVGMLQTAMKATGGNTEELKKLIPNIAAWTAATDLGGKGAQSYAQAMQTMSKSAGSTNSAMEEQEKGFAEQVARMKASLETLQITFVQSFGPSLTGIVNGISSLIKAFTSLSPSAQKLIGELLVGVLVFSTVASKLFMIGSGLAALVSAFGATAAPITITIVAISALIAGITLLIMNWNSLNTATKVVVDVIIGAAAAFGIYKAVMLAMEAPTLIMAAATKVATGAQLLFNAAMSANIIGVVIAAIVGLIAAFVLLYNNCTPFRNFINALWNDMKNFGSWIASGFKQAISSIGITFTAIRNTIASALGSIPNLFNNIRNAIINIFNGIRSTVINIISGLINGIISFFGNMRAGITNILNGLSQYFTGIWQLIKTVTLGPVLLLIDLVTGNFTKLSSDAKLIFNDLKTALGNIFGGLRDIVIGIVQAWAGFLSSVWNGIKDLAISIWNSLKNSVTSIVTSLVNDAINIFNGIVNFFRNLPGTLYNLGVNAFNALKNGISSIINTIGSAVENGFNNAISFLKSLPSQAFHWGSDIINGIVNGIKSAAGAVGDAINGVAQNIRSFLHFSVPDKGPLADFDTYMPDMMNGLANGMTNNISKVKTAATNVAQTLKSALMPSSVSVVGSTAVQGSSSSGNGSITDAIVSALKPQSTTNNTVYNSNNQQQPLYVVMDKEVVGRIMSKQLDVTQDTDVKLRLRGRGKQ